MRVATFRQTDGLHLGVIDGTDIIDVTAGGGLPGDVGTLLGRGQGFDAVARVAAAPSSPRLELASVKLGPPVARPPKLLAIGLNYAAHAAESATPKPAVQLWFNKQPTCVIGPGDAIEVPLVSSMVDYEGELAFVIGRRCRHVAPVDAPSVIAGYTIVNDVSVRDWQRASPTMTMGKSFDTHGPMGPLLVTADEVGDPHGLRLRTWVNDELRQDAATDDLIYDCWQMVEHLSTAFTLEPGDVISTGTPAGVGMAMDPPRWLQAGDTVRIEIEGIGSLVNPVVDERA